MSAPAEGVFAARSEEQFRSLLGAMRPGPEHIKAPVFNRLEHRANNGNTKQANMHKAMLEVEGQNEAESDAQSAPGAAVSGHGGAGHTVGE